MNIQLDYEPRDPFKSFHMRKERYACLVAHRRAGKTVACIGELVVRALHTRKKNARFAYIAPFRSQAKAVAWTYLKEMTMDFAVQIRESDLRVELPNGAWIQLFGSDNVDALRGLYFDGIVVDEVADCRPNLWGEILTPTLADRKGWAVMIGTPKGKNMFYDFHMLAQESPLWYHMLLKSSESGLLPKEEIENMRSIMTAEQFEQEMECSFTSPVLGTYYASLIEMLEQRSQIAPKACQYDPAFPVEMVTDLGYTDSTAMWFWQERPDGLAIVDYYENDSRPLSHYFDILDYKGYEYKTIWLPHDAKAKTLQTGRSTAEQFIDRYRDTEVELSIVPSLSKQHGIDAARLVLPLCWFDLDTTYNGVEALRAYRRKFNEATKQFSNEPLHDWSSNGADAFRYLALVCKDKLNIELPKKLYEEFKPKTYPFNLQMLFDDNERQTLGFARRRI